VRKLLWGIQRPTSRGAIRAVAIFGGIAVWIGGVVLGLGLLASYSNAASPAATAPGLWPAGSTIAKAQGSAHLLVFLHPRCPCSAATLGELNRILARAPGVQVTMMFFVPPDADDTWRSGSLRRRAEGLQGSTVRIVDDPAGSEASNFGAKSSGHTVLYDADGRLLFSGGITASRGHEGDNAGSDAIVAFLAGKQHPVSRTPTFGCELSQTNGCDACAEDAR
jgi:hypothetical protein